MAAGWNLQPSRSEYAALMVLCGLAGLVAGVTASVLVARHT